MSSTYPFGGPPTQLCQRCGKQLPPDEEFCRTCGFHNTLSPTKGFTSHSQPPSAAQYSRQQWEQAFSSSPVQNIPYNSGPSSHQQPYSSSNYTETPNTAFNPNNYYVRPGLRPYEGPQLPFHTSPPLQEAPQQSFYTPPLAPSMGSYAQGDGNHLQQNIFNAPPPQKKPLRIALIIGVVILLLLLIGASFIGYMYIKTKDNTSVTPTATLSPTPSVKPLFRDSFNNNNTGWDLTSSSGKFSVQVGSGKMILEDDNNRLLWEILPGKPFTDFRLNVDAVLSEGDPNSGFGVYIRGGSSQDSELGTYYRFELYGDSTYAIFKGTLDSTGTSQSTKIQGYISDPAIAKKGALNHITIIAKGQNMTFIVNGKTLYTVSDTSYKSGFIALFVSNLPNTPPGAQATFTNLAIYPK